MLTDHVPFVETDLGFEFANSQYFVFFGKKDSSLQNLANAYPQFQFKSLDQVHGCEIVESNENSLNDRKADAHFTHKKNLALVVKTADCMPVLAFDSLEKRIFAIHAGWRGVEKRIILTALADSKQASIFIGPHIRYESFEIQENCFLALKQASKLAPHEWFKNHHADLSKIVTAQISERTFASDQAKTLSLDTKTDLRFHSYRRDGLSSGRQNNFIALL